jgi:hypothetical protein
MKKLLLSALLCGGMTLAWGDVIPLFNNLGDGYSNDPQVGGTYIQNCADPQNIGNGYCIAGTFGPIYDSFNTLTATAITDVTVKVALGALETVSGPGPVSVDLYSDASGLPGNWAANVGSINESELTLGVWSLKSFTGLNLGVLTNTRYWIGLSAINGTSAVWEFSNGNPELGTAGQYWFTPTYSAQPDDLGAYLMSVDGYKQPDNPPDTPEPAAAFLVGGALVGAGLIFRRKRNA